MHLFLLGVSHRTAPVELRERLDFSSRDLGAAVEALATRPSAGRVGRAVDVQPVRDLRRQRRPGARARRDHRVPQRVPSACRAESVHAAPVLARRRGRRRASVPRRRRSRLAGRRRAADPRTGEGRVPGGRGTSLHRADAEQAVPLVVRRRQARADGDRRSAKARCRSASPPSRWRERSSGDSRAGACSSSAPARSAR